MAGAPYSAIVNGLAGVDSLMMEMEDMHVAMVLYNSSAEVVGSIKRGNTAATAKRYIVTCDMDARRAPLQRQHSACA